MVNTYIDDVNRDKAKDENVDKEDKNGDEKENEDEMKLFFLLQLFALGFFSEVVLTASLFARQDQDQQCFPTVSTDSCACSPAYTCKIDQNQPLPNVPSEVQNLESYASECAAAVSCKFINPDSIVHCSVGSEGLGCNNVEAFTSTFTCKTETIGT
ncbi:35024_t:CDS:2, partial [Gigaspora margarita]